MTEINGGRGNANRRSKYALQAYPSNIRDVEERTGASDVRREVRDPPGRIPASASIACITVVASGSPRDSSLCFRGMLDVAGLIRIKTCRSMFTTIHG
ncbi:MAG: hypothetical protein ACM338_12105 [Betaproteobacteria bacterium]